MAPSAEELNRDKFKLISSSVSGYKRDEKNGTAVEMAAEMTFAHNILIRGVAAIYAQAVHVADHGSAQDKLDFANFAYAWSLMIMEHHEFEETTAFPDINRLTGIDGLMDANVSEHELFHTELNKFQEYIELVRSEKADLDGAKLCAIIDAFMPILRQHLENEITTLVQLKEYQDKVNWKKWFDGMVQEVVGRAMKSASYRVEVFPLAFCLNDNSFEDGVWSDKPAVPWLAKLFLRWMYMGTKKAWWRFAPCDMYCQPKEMPFAS